MHGYGRSTDLLSHADIHLYGRIYVGSANYCPDYHPSL